MPTNRVTFHEEAGTEYDAAFDWYLARSPDAALKFALGCKEGSPSERISILDLRRLGEPNRLLRLTADADIQPRPLVNS
jgi:hypothetical protein